MSPSYHGYASVRARKGSVQAGDSVCQVWARLSFSDKQHHLMHGGDPRHGRRSTCCCSSKHLTLARCEGSALLRRIEPTAAASLPAVASPPKADTAHGKHTQRRYAEGARMLRHAGVHSPESSDRLAAQCALRPASLLPSVSVSRENSRFRNYKVADAPYFICHAFKPPENAK
jgi:hypothetical protein